MRIASDLLPASAHRRGPKNLILYFLPDEDDLALTRSAKARLNRGGVRFELPGGAEKLHPDLYALACLLLVAPYTAKSITFDQPVSPGFAALVQLHHRISIGPIDASIAPRETSANMLDAIAFSGGVDSCAALWLYPRKSVALFLDRTATRNPPRSIYRPDAAYRTIRAVQRSGRRVIQVKTNLEFVRDPVGFPVDWSNAAPTVLLADHLGLRSVGFGMIAESAYRLGHVVFSELRDRKIYSAWAPLFEAVGLPISLPTAALSEVLTSRIAATDLGKWHPQSCVRGTSTEPCGRCFKCFRKTLLEASLSGAVVPDAHFDVGLGSAEVRKKLSDVPVHHEGVLAYSMHRMAPSEHPLARCLTDLTRPTVAHTGGTDLFDRYYGPALAYVPEHLRDHVQSRIERFAEPMTAQDEEIIRGWDLNRVTADPVYATARETLRSMTGLPDRPV